MTKSDCLRWAKALINGEFHQFIGSMSDSSSTEDKPRACCCLGVLNETFKPKDYKWDRMDAHAQRACYQGIINDSNPKIFGMLASQLNDGCNKLTELTMSSGYKAESRGISHEGLTHEEIGILLLLAVESGEYVNI